MTNDVIVIHLGASLNVSCLKKQNQKKLLIKSLETGHKLLNQEKSAEFVVTKLICILEDSGIVNCGKGSNLNFNGIAECDASIYSGKTGNCASVGALEGIKNPILAAYHLMNSREKYTFGLVPPITLTGDGARRFCESENLETVARDYFYNKSKLTGYKKLLSIIENGSYKLEAKFAKTSDTVGVIVLTKQGDFCCGSSSGGNILKHSGRIGSAAVCGAGTFCQNYNSENAMGGAICVSGTGEEIMKRFVARTLFEKIKAEGNDDNTIQNYVKEFKAGHEEYQKHLGLIMLVQRQPSKIKFYFSHTTPELAIGYITNKTPKIIFSKQKTNHIVVNAFNLKLSNQNLMIL